MCSKVQDDRRPQERRKHDRRIGDRRTRDLQDLLDDIKQTESDLQAYIDNILRDAGINPDSGEEISDGS